MNKFLVRQRAIVSRLVIVVSVLAASTLGLMNAASAASPVFDWTGFYVGANVGYGWGNSDANLTFSDSGGVLFNASGNIKATGAIAGGGGGYNWQSGQWVFGIEADLQWSGQKGSQDFVCPAGTCNGLAVTASVTEKLEWFGTVRPRAGWLVTPTTLVYATGGLAYGKVDESGIVTNGVLTTPFDFSRTSVGWVVGAGVEGQLSGNWNWKVEYLYLQLREPDGSVATTITFRTPVTVEIDPIFHDNIIRVGLNYKFGAEPEPKRLLITK